MKPARMPTQLWEMSRPKAVRATAQATGCSMNPLVSKVLYVRVESVMLTVTFPRASLGS